MIKVSIIVPVYNVEDYIDKCLISLVGQTLKEIQIIIVNDGSEDNSKQIILKYKEKYSDRILYIEKINEGVAAARNVGLFFAKGEYIGFVDGDDYIDEKMFEKMYKKVKKENTDMVICDYYSVYKEKLSYKGSGLCKSKNDMFFQKGMMCNKLISAEIIKNNKILFPVGLKYEDGEYLCKIFPYIKNISFIYEPLYFYVQRNNSAEHTYNERTKDIFIIWENIINFYKNNNLYEKYKTKLEYRCTISLLITSFFRMIKIKNTKLRIESLKANWNYLIKIFPYWRNNPILKKNNSKVDIYLKSQNYITYLLFSVFFSSLNKLKSLFQVNNK